MDETRIEKLYEKMLYDGVHTLKPYELAQMFLGLVQPNSETESISIDLIEEFGSFYNACNAPSSKLQEIKGISEQTAKQMNYFPILARAYKMSMYDKKRVFESRDEIARYCVDLLGGRVNEHFYILCFNGKNEFIKRIHIAEGTPDQVSVQPRQVIDKVINTPTKSVVLTHNHPGGSLVQSQSDKITTANMSVALENIGVTLSDHIVVGEFKYTFIRF